MHAFLARLAPLVMAAVALAAPAHGATLTVDRTDDVPGGTCSDAVEGDCSLRTAVEIANEREGLDTIVVPAGTYTLVHAAPPDPSGFDVNAALLILEDVTITGAGADSTIIQTCTVPQKTAPCPTGQGIARRIFAMGEVVMDVEIADVTLRHGRADGTTVSVSGGNGGALYNGVAPTVTLRRAIVADNASSTEGGGLFNRGPETLILIGTTVSGNVSRNGGGIANIHGGSARLIRTTVSGNVAQEEGGGIYNRTGATLTLTNSTVSGNTAAGNGGGVSNAGTLRVIATTIASNTTVSGEGGGLATGASPELAEIGNSIIADNVAPSGAAPDCSGAATSLGSVLIEDPRGCALESGPGDIIGLDPLLGPLAPNGGPTLTHALLPGSPALDAGDEVLCPADDQRGVVRPTDGDDDGLAVCDIGAYEADGEPGEDETLPLERVGRAEFLLRRGEKTEQFTDQELRFTLATGQTIDPFTEVFRLTLSEPGCGGVFSDLVLPAGSFQPRRGGDVAEARVRTADGVTGAQLRGLISLEALAGGEYALRVRITDAIYHCLRGESDRSVTLSVAIGDVTAELTAPFHRNRNGNLLAP